MPHPLVYSNIYGNREDPDVTHSGPRSTHAPETHAPETHAGAPNQSELPPIVPVKKNVEFPPLTDQPVPGGASVPPSNPVDHLTLEKSTPVPPSQPEEHIVHKELSQVIPDTEEMQTFGSRQVRHLNAITSELKLLLEHEQKILEQVMARIDKFKALRDENKRKSTEWENEYKSKIPEYDAYSTKLINVPYVEDVSVEGVPTPVQQKILFKIVSRTTNTANRVVVQLSMEEAVSNDIDLTLQDLKKHCAVMLKQINGWLRMIKTQLCHQAIVIERWDEIKILIRQIIGKAETISNTTVPTTHVDNSLRMYEQRLLIIEAAICKMCGISCGTCPEGWQDPPQPPPFINPDPNSQRQPQCPQPDPSFTPCQPTIYDIDPPGPNTSRDQCNERLKQIEEAVRKLCDDVRRPTRSAPSPTRSRPRSNPCPVPAYLMSTPPGSPPPRPTSPAPPPSPGITRSPEQPPLPPVADVRSPQLRQEHLSPGGGGSPGSPGLYLSIPVPALAYPEEPVNDDLGELRRDRAPPGAFPDLELVDTPGMGYPVPRAALERGGRTPGQNVPLSPPSPPLPHMGRFRPLAISSPPEGGSVRRLREQRCPLPENPMAGQPVDPALLPKIQGDLQRLADRNRNLQELVNNFKRIRCTLTSEIDKAVRLNQKLQRDLYYVAESNRQ